MSYEVHQVKNLKRIVSVLLVLAMALAPCLADALSTRFSVEEAADSDYDGIPDAYDAAPSSNVFTGQMKSGHDGKTTVSYTMDFRNFFGDNTVYHPELASVSVIGAAMAYYTPSHGESYVTYSPAQTWEGGSYTDADGMEILRLHGFSDVVDYTLDSYGDDDICEVVMGHRAYAYNGETKVIVAIWVRGTDAESEEEWSSNFHVGDLVRFFDEYDSVAGKTPRQSNDDWTRKTNHRGFDVCATRLLRYLDTYYFEPYVQPELDANPGSSLTYWLAGHSRGAAVANLMASYLIDEGNEVYAYTFAAPNNTANTEASAEKYDCIFNLVNSNDFVPMLPMVEWGFTRFGRTAQVDASQWSSQIKTATGETYSGKFLTESDMSTLLGKFICITGENADRSNPGKILGWREVYVYHCGHTHEGETVGSYQSTTIVTGVSASGFLGLYGYNSYADHLKKYTYHNSSTENLCETPAYCMQVLVELLVKIAKGETVNGASTYMLSNKLAKKFDFDKWSLLEYRDQLTEPHFMDTYSVIQAQINAAGDPGARFHTMSYYTAENADGGRPAHTHTYTYVPYEGHEPTCETDGLGYRYCLCSQANEDYYDDYQKNVVIPALGHDWNAATYVWSDDNLTCTASHTCTREASHTETETAAALCQIVSEPTLYETGLARYTVHFENEAFADQVIEAEMPMLPGFTVTFMDMDGGAVLSAVRVAPGGAAEAPAAPEHAYCVFIGWDIDFSEVTQDITVTALYRKLGDVDENYRVDLADSNCLVMYILNLTTLEGNGLLNADVNGDGCTNVLDLPALWEIALSVR